MSLAERIAMPAMCRQTQSAAASIVRAHYETGYAAGMTVAAGAPGPAVAAIGERLLDRVDELATELTEVIRRDEPFYSAGGVVPAEDLRASVRDNLVHILSRFAGRPTPGLEPPRATGRRRAEQGVPLAVILHAYRVAGKFIWAAILAEAEPATSATTALLRRRHPSCG